MGNNFEFDKIVISIALAIFVVIFSNNLGGFIYRTENIPNKPGYEIEIVEVSTGADEGPKGLPEKIQIGKIMATANAEAGKAIFNKCAICHTSDKGAANKVGPNLWGIVGAITARHEEFKYSDAMKKRHTDGKVWSYEELYRYLYSPKQFVPGTKMAFAGLKKDDERANLISYLRTLSDSPLPLPVIESDTPAAANPPVG